MDEQNRLSKLSSEKLAAALLELATYSFEAQAVVARLLASPRENASNFQEMLSTFVNRKHFISYSESGGYANQLRSLLKTLEASECEPKWGVLSVAAFYRSDAEILNNCDDSDGVVGEVFFGDATDLFVSYASKCEDKEWLLDLVIELNQQNEYCVRQALIERSPEFLTKEYSLEAVDKLWVLAKSARNESERRQWFLALKMLGLSLKDPELLERVYDQKESGLRSDDTQMEIAELHFELGNFDEALCWCLKISDRSYHSLHRDELLVQIYEKQGNVEKRAEKAWKIFQRGRSVESLNLLLAAIGEEQRELIVEEEAKKILRSRTFNTDDAFFLLQSDRLESAEAYVIDRATKLEGSLYWPLLELSKLFVDQGKILAATLIYRALLNSILERGKSSTYHHGIDYLHTLDKWAPTIDDWKRFQPHDSYVAELRGTHKRKYGFWSKYAPQAVQA